jgi:glycosyltransferase involved in cell wall biosynthesis
MRPDALATIGSFDIFVLPSLWEGLPYALLEAMLLRRPVVATAVTGSRDLIQSEHDGVLVPPGNSDALARAVVRLILDKDLRVNLGAFGEQSIRRRYSVASSIEKIAALYEDLAG